MSIYAGRWDCPICKRTGNYGPNTHCGGCWASRGKNVRFYLPDGERAITDVSEIEKAYSGPGIKCDHCDADNKGWEKFCTSCGDALNNEDVKRKVQDYTENNTPKSSEVVSKNISDLGNRAMTGRFQSEYPNYSNIPKSINKTHKINGRERRYLTLKTLCVVSILALFSIFLSICISSEEVELTVIRHSWERSIEILKYKTEIEEDWNMPSNAQYIEKKEKVYSHKSVFSHNETAYEDVKVKDGTKRVVCGKTDLGNGYFEDKFCDEDTYKVVSQPYNKPVYEQEPVYKTWYKYKIRKLVHDRTERLSGNDKNPSWPSFELKSDDEQAGDKQEAYTVHLRGSDNEIYREKIKFENWSKISNHDKMYDTKTPCIGVHNITIHRKGTK